MKIDERDKIDFGKEKIGVLFGKLFVPTVLGMLFEALLTFTDGIFVGRGVGSNALAAVNIVAPLFLFTTGVGLMFGIGVSVVSSIHLAREHVKAARINVTQCIMVSSLFMILVSLFSFFFCPAFVRFLGSTPELHEYTEEYMYYFAPFCLFLMLQCIGLFIIRLDGSPKFAMMCSVVPSLVNLVLDYIFIFPLHMGLKGAALATDAGVFVGAFMVMYYMVFRSSTLRLYRLKTTVKSMLLTVRNVGYMLRVGVSGMIAEVAVAVMMYTGNYVFMKHYGGDGVAAYSVACYLFPLFFMIDNAVAQASQPILSFNYGAGNWHRVKYAFMFTLTVSFLCGLAACLVMAFMDGTLVEMFLDETSHPYKIAIEGLPYFSIGCIFLALNNAFIGYYQSLERALRASIFTVVRGIVLSSVAFLTLPHIIGNVGIWLAVPVAEALTFIIILIDYFWERRRLSIQ